MLGKCEGGKRRAFYKKEEARSEATRARAGEKAAAGPAVAVAVAIPRAP